MNATTIPKKYVLTGRAVVHRVPGVLAGRGLKPAFSRWVMTSNANHVWLFGVLDLPKLERLERYTDGALLHHLSTACDGVPADGATVRARGRGREGAAPRGARSRPAAPRGASNARSPRTPRACALPPPSTARRTLM